MNRKIVKGRGKMTIAKRLVATLSLSLMLLLSNRPAHAEESIVYPVAKAANEFAVDIYKRLSKSPENIFFSPHSISLALAITAAGARGDTAAQMKNVLHVGSIPGDTLDGFAALQSSVANTKGIQLTIANSLWYEQQYPLTKDYTELISSKYEAQLEAADFLHAAETVASKINLWVENRTHQLIKEIVQPHQLTSDTRLVLVNAIYFKAHWGKEFSKTATRSEPFKELDGGSGSVQMMQKTEWYQYFENEFLQMVELPYKDNSTPPLMYNSDNMSMVVILPRKTDGLRELETSVTELDISSWLSQVRVKHIELRLPRFRIEAGKNLAPHLIEMGMSDAFQIGKADFSGMDGTKTLCISDVLHKAFIDVDEQGTEAAAATAVLVVKGKYIDREKPIVFTADHPFLFLIRHRPSGAILFMGRLGKPAGA